MTDILAKSYPKSHPGMTLIRRDGKTQEVRSAARIDHFFTTKNLANYVNGAGIDTNRYGVSTDHQPILMNIDIEDLTKSKIVTHEETKRS